MAHSPAYATLADLQTRFGASVMSRLANEKGATTPGGPATAVVEAFIELAAVEVDDALGAHGLYSVPLTAVPDGVRVRVEEMVFHQLGVERHNVTAYAVQRLQEIRDWFIAAGQGSRIIPGLGTPAGSKTSSTTNDGRERLFSRSHYDSEGTKIESTDWVGTLDPYSTT